MSGRWDHGRALYALLPIVYRVRDRDDDLARLLEACGVLFDRIGETLDQRLADCFPDPDGGPDGRASQEWLLPYFADLVDASLASPHVSGRRREVAQAIEWRQKKGTLGAAESIAEAVVGRGRSGLGGREVELREGFRLVATTAGVEGPLGDAVRRELGARIVTPGTGARRPATTVQVDRPSRAVRLSGDTPGSRRSSFGTGGRIPWGVLHPDGVPCFPGSYDDVARRTVDVRTPRATVGHAHARRLLVHVATPRGFFKPGHSDRRGAPAQAQAQDVGHDAGLLELHDKRIGLLEVASGRVRLHGCTVERVLGGPETLVTATASVLGEVESAGTVRLRHTTVTGGVAADVLTAANCLLDAVEARRARVQRCAVRTLTATGYARAERTLVDRLTVGARARLMYVTVLGEASVDGTLEASEALFAGSLSAARGAARYSRLPALPPQLRTYAVTTGAPRFLAGWGVPGCGVLDAGSPPAIRFGAEDGGEIGAYHDDVYGLEDVALRDRLTDHLPYGIEPVLVPDPRLHQPPPTLTPTTRHP